MLCSMNVTISLILNIYKIYLTNLKFILNLII